MSTNANSRLIANILADARAGTFTGLVQTLKGTERLAPGEKRGGEKRTYGDDTVHVCIFTGFKYTALCQRSLDAIAEMSVHSLLAEMQAAGLKGWEGRGDKAVEVEITLADVQNAKDRLTASWTLSRDGMNQSTNDHVFEPLTVDGEVVRGCRVYTGQTADAVAAGVPAPAKVGTIYLHGLQISRKVLTPAKHGPAPESKSSARVVAEEFITDRTPMAAYRSYRLEPGTDFLLRAGGTAEVAAEKDGIVFTPEIRDALKARQAA
jgi:hypothetical protein